MPYFSRLTDIVTCSLTKILAEASDPEATLSEIISEMEEGLAGADRSAKTAAANEERLRGEIEGHGSQVAMWTVKAKDELAQNNEEEARTALMRKREVEDLIAGLNQQLEAAEATRQHLSTTQRALEARLAEAVRKQAKMQGDAEPSTDQPVAAATSQPVSASGDDTRARQIDDELEKLKRELGQGG